MPTRMPTERFAELIGSLVACEASPFLVCVARSHPSAFNRLCGYSCLFLPYAWLCRRSKLPAAQV